MGDATDVSDRQDRHTLYVEKLGLFGQKHRSQASDAVRGTMTGAEYSTLEIVSVGRIAALLVNSVCLPVLLSATTQDEYIYFY